MGVILFGGAQYSLPEQGGEVTKKFFPDIPKKCFPDIHTYKHSTKFSRHSKKNSRNFRKDTKIFLRHQNFSEIFMFCPNFAVIFARP